MAGLPRFDWRMLAVSTAIGGAIAALTPAFHGRERIPRWLIPEVQYVVAGWVILITVITFGAFIVDKILAKANARRISENRLHWMVALGGVLGAILGMIVARHKTIDPVFRLRLVIVVLPQLVTAAGVAWIVHRACCG